MRNSRIQPGWRSVFELCLTVFWDWCLMMLARASGFLD